jgi:predicted DNA-binding transcriptional regulator AlpA
MSVKGTPVRNAKFRELLVYTPPTAAGLTRSPEDESFITYNQLPDYGIPQYSRVHIRRLMARGLFPRPVMLSPNRIAWRKSEVAAWKTSRPRAPLPADAS